jgi:hypothetical protein
LSFWFKRDKLREFVAISICAVGLVFAVLTSLPILKTPIPIDNINNKHFGLERFLTSDVQFLLFLLIKCVIIFIITMMGFYILNIKRMVEHSTKVGPFELNGKWQEADLIAENTKKASSHFDLLVELSQNIYKKTVSEFEKDIIAAPDQAEAIRNMVEGVLKDSYFNQKKNRVVIHVKPLTEKGLGELSPKQADFIRDYVKTNGDEQPCILKMNSMTKIAIIPGDDLTSVIVIDTTKQDYEVTDVEIFSAAQFMTAVAIIIQWKICSQAIQKI